MSPDLSTKVMYLERDPHPLDHCGYSSHGWYFWDETDTWCYGPFRSKKTALEALKEYAKALSKPSSDLTN